MPDYRVNFVNQTSAIWTMAVYQTLPSSVGLDSVAWKQSTAPQGGRTGVQWTTIFNVALADYEQLGGLGVYVASQLLTTLLGKRWEVVFEQNVQHLKPAEGSVEPDQVLILNKSGYLANIGIGMDGSGSVFKRDVVSRGNAQFKVTPTYWVALFNQVTLGEVISGNVIVGPLEVKYPSGMTSATLTALMDGNNIVLDLKYGQMAVADMSTVNLMIEDQQRLRKGLGGKYAPRLMAGQPAPGDNSL